MTTLLAMAAAVVLAAGGSCKKDKPKPSGGSKQASGPGAGGPRDAGPKPSTAPDAAPGKTPGADAQVGPAPMPAPMLGPPPGPMIRPQPIAPDKRAHRIQLTRPVRAGYRYRLSVAGRTLREMTLTGGALPQATLDGYTFQYEAKVIVRATNARGEATAERHEIVRFERKSGAGVSTALAQAGTVVEAKIAGGQKRFAAGGATLSEDAKLILAQVAELATGGPSDDQTYGSAKTHKVGATWPVNAAALAGKLAAGLRGRIQPTPRATNIRGKVTFSRLVKHGGVDCAQIDVAATLSGVALPPAGYTLKKATTELKLSRTLPLAANRRPPLTQAQIVTTYAATIRKDGKPFTLTAKITHHVTREETPQ